MEQEAEKLKALQSEVEQQISADVRGKAFSKRKELSCVFRAGKSELPDDGGKDGDRQSVDLRWTGDFYDDLAGFDGDFRWITRARLKSLSNIFTAAEG